MDDDIDSVDVMLLDIDEVVDEPIGLRVHRLDGVIYVVDTDMLV